MSGASQITWDEVGNAPQPAAPQISWDAPDPELPKVTTSTNPKAMMAINAAHDIEQHPIRSEIAGGIGVAGAGAMGAAALGETPLIGPALKWGARKIAPIAGPILASEGIRAARNIPVVGKFIPPYSEFLPFLAGGGKGKAAEEAGELDATGENKPFLGGMDEYVPPKQPSQTRPIGKSQPIEEEPIATPQAMRREQELQAFKEGQQEGERIHGPLSDHVRADSIGSVAAQRGKAAFEAAGSLHSAPAGKPEPIADAATPEASANAEPAAATSAPKPAPKAVAKPASKASPSPRLKGIAGTNMTGPELEQALAKDIAKIKAGGYPPMTEEEPQALPTNPEGEDLTPQLLQSLRIAQARKSASAQPIQ